MINIKDKTFLLSSTVRYCLGRQTYTVGWIRDILRNEWKNIPQNDKKIILDDINDYLKEKYVTSLDRMVWNEILDWGREEGLIVKEK